MKINKIIIIILFSIIFINSVDASQNKTVINIDNIKNKQTVSYNDIINTQINVIDNSDRIINIDVSLNIDDADNNGLVINLSEKFNIVVLSKKYTYYLIPMQEVILYGYYDNVTIFRESNNYSNLLDMDLLTVIKYDVTTENTSVRLQPHISKPLFFETNSFMGLPANNIHIKGTSKFNFNAYVIDYSNYLAQNSAKNDLGSVTGGLYYLLTIGNLFESASLIIVLRLLDTIFDIFNFIFNILFVFPFLLLFWMVIMGNFYAGFKSNDRKELIIYYMEYYKFIGLCLVGLMKWVYNVILRLITAIGNLLPFT